MPIQRTENEVIKKRLSFCSCPIHNIGMVQSCDNGYINSQRDHYLVQCPRHDCNIKGTTSEPHGAVTLLPQFVYLLHTS